MFTMKQLSTGTDVLRGGGIPILEDIQNSTKHVPEQPDLTLKLAQPCAASWTGTS